MVYLVIVLSVLADQLSKWVMSAWLKPDKTFPIITDVLHFSYTENTGAAWGMFKDARWLFMSVSTIAILAILAYLIFYKNHPKGTKWALALICGGGIGNMIDRVFLGYVVDFVDFRLIDFPLFNIADSCVCVGTFLFLFFFLKDEWETEKNKKKQEDPS